jgi:hypothetical protein
MIFAGEAKNVFQAIQDNSPHQIGPSKLYQVPVFLYFVLGPLALFTGRLSSFSQSSPLGFLL